MSLRTSPWPNGVPCWADLQVPDVSAALEFYSDVLGWSFAPPAEEFGGYVMAERKGGPTAGIGPKMTEDAPTAWTLYFATDDIEATCAAVSANGGTIFFPPDDVGALGRMAIVADPTGGAFGVWQAGTHIGAGLVNEPGGITWEDLRSTNPEVARTFYTAVFGFEYDDVMGAGEGYMTFNEPGQDYPLGGIGGMFGPEEVPSHWLVYFGVDDAGGAADVVERRGGTVMVKDFETPYGTMAGFLDPWGAMFWVVETGSEGQGPDRSG